MTLLSTLLAASRGFGMRRKIVQDAAGHATLSYRALWTRSFALSAVLPLQGKYVGVLLPTSLPALVTFLALHLRGRVPAMLNATAGARNLVAACAMAEVKTIVTARAFVEKAKLQEPVKALSEHCRIVYLEDMRSRIGLKQKLLAVVRALAPEGLLPAGSPADPAVILFTSGSEGQPKGVALSHFNLLSNIGQAKLCFHFTPADVMLNPLPMFHSFGLTAGTLLPLFLGFRTVLYPSPLHYHVIPKLCKQVGATIFLGTDTFYNGYARAAHDGDFSTVRLAVAGAEKLRESTRTLYAERFGIHIMQGYGVTETSPVIACNSPENNKPGTVGRAMSGIGCKLESVEGITQGGRLFVSGPNVMLGYVKHDQPGAIQPQGEWYDTGDIVDIDDAGYLTILGRAKRFAKIGGEMVSLAAVEELALALWPEHVHAAMAAPDERKGEQIVLFTECKDATRDALLSHAQAHGVNELMLPRKVVFKEPLPRLGSGKVDYMALKAISAD